MCSFIANTTMFGYLLIVTLVNEVRPQSLEYIVCPDGQFAPAGDGACRPCSTCPMNEVVKEMCSGDRDTVCGPFVEFKMFSFRQDVKQRTKLVSACTYSCCVSSYNCKIVYALHVHSLSIRIFNNFDHKIYLTFKI